MPVTPAVPQPVVDRAALRTVPILRTPRLVLVPLGPEHLDATWDALQDPESMRLTGTHATFTREQVAAHLERVAAADDRADWAITLPDGAYVGEVVLNDLDDDNACMNVRIALATGMPGRGYGTEAMTAVLDHAFGRVGLHRVQLDVFDFNPRAQRSYEKAGFVVEGRQRDTLLWDGEWSGSVLMAVLATDERPSDG
ncbi:GNAT family N-acetyltransferase [Cellulomonas sp. DKR-3]|uniref:GNAT family N-acetyltransferase n=1 Tax=Cellulomonas fulva TaxID=2835530 RepID=A0ABS5TUU0_9CELL|nr:GNAT family N-acetyltransferase [Cellulomonas fulva]MBT0992877.1 GNAT family N-acetyltransferase [Cellulomonas fulva]